MEKTRMTMQNQQKAKAKRIILICLYVCFLQLLKVDVQTKKCLEWIEEGCHCSEPIFVPKPDAQDEDEGTIFWDILVLSSFCHFGSHCYTVLLFWPVEFSPLVVM